MHWFTADLHLSHNKILIHCFETRKHFLTPDDKEQAIHLIQEKRVKEFIPSKESRENMDGSILHNINEKVKEKDTLWILGDFSFATDKALGDQFGRINCKDVRMVWGNHDRRNHVYKECGFTQHWNSVILYRFKDLRDELFTDTEVFESKELRRKLEKHFKKTEKIHLSHYASLVWPIGKNCWSLWGHSHGNLTHPMENVPGMDVGVDAVHKHGFAGFAPVSLEELDAFIQPRLLTFTKPMDG